MTRQVQVPRQRWARWVDGFAARHGTIDAVHTGQQVTVTAADGAVAAVEVPFPPLPPTADPLAELGRHVGLDRRVGLLLVRLGGHAVGVAAGERLVASKVGSGYVQGRTKAGGWSQQRYARRRGNQARQAYADAADTAARLLLPELADLQAVVTGGDAPAVRAVLGDPRLSALLPLVQPRVHPVPDPRLRVLTAFPETCLALRITLNELA